MAWTAWEKVAGFDFKEVIYEKKYHVELEGGVARITWNYGPGQMNLTQGMIREAGRAYHDASNDLMIGVVVLTGAGDRVFHTGGDVAAEGETARRGLLLGQAGATAFRESSAVQQSQEPMQQSQAPTETYRTCLKPVIARVNGYAIGNGFHQALECDVTIAAEHAIFGHNGPRVSSPVAGAYISYPSFVIGLKRAKEMNFTCGRYTAQEAFEMGLVNKVVRYEKLDEEVDKWCEEILKASPICIQMRKRSFEAVYNLANISRDAFLEEVAPGFSGSPEHKEGSTAFLEKRPTSFWKLRKELGEAAYDVKKE